MKSYFLAIADAGTAEMHISSGNTECSDYNRGMACKYSQKIQALTEICLDVRHQEDDKVSAASDVIIEAGKASHDHYLQGIGIYARCFVLYRNGHTMKANHDLRKALSHLSHTRVWPQLISTLNMIGLISMRLGDTASAMESFLQALTIAEQYSQTADIELLNINLTDVCLRADAFGNAYAYILKAESLLDSLKQSERYVEFACIAIGEAALLAMFTHQDEDARKHMKLLDDLVQDHPEAADNPVLKILELYSIKDPVSAHACAVRLLPFMKRKDILDEGGTEFLFYLRYLSSHGFKEEFHQISTYFIRSLNEESMPGDIIPALQEIVAFEEASGQRESFLRDLQLLWKYARIADKASRESMIHYIETRNTLRDTIRQNQILTHLADTDPLSGIANRRYLSKVADEWFETARTKNIPFAVEMIDIDHFKTINDTKGHDAGDAAIRIMAGCLQNIHDGTKIFVSRYGGDEFIVLYLGMTFDQVKEKAIALRDSVAAASTKAGIPMTISQGIVHHKIRADNKIWDYTSNADYAMYYAKKSHPGAIMIIDHQKDLQHPLYED